ncbi:protealysin inhibitor emfourin [Flavisolibacter ginsenosidimutans]|uniref:Uncharacterized protein n=1 Tax=Flavisolibacter ginsenosidimutans TaxID=661481 RepID=A0A5B8UM07_9BACT|nr:protealysin inhibitor emfourin [Flavisolibacter ginsenosidimutans]QEC57065.1 hypothetical protein FSB75_14520 [Flavisolibacter ginsenosidimutans]
MKLKLIQAGGFAGLKKTAEEDLSDYPDEVKDAVKKVFEEPAKTSSPSAARDQEQHFLELDGKVVPVDADKQPKALQNLLAKMKTNLTLQSR